MSARSDDHTDGAIDPAFHHAPVMRDEVVETFRAVPAGVVLDATLGGGGHSEGFSDSGGAGPARPNHGSPAHRRERANG